MIPSIFTPTTIRNGFLIKFYKNVQIDPQTRYNQKASEWVSLWHLSNKLQRSWASKLRGDNLRIVDTKTISNEKVAQFLSFFVEIFVNFPLGAFLLVFATLEHKSFYKPYLKHCVLSRSYKQPFKNELILLPL